MRIGIFYQFRVDEEVYVEFASAIANLVEEIPRVELLASSEYEAD